MNAAPVRTERAPIVFTFRLPPRSPIAAQFTASRARPNGVTLQFTRKPSTFHLRGASK